MKAMILAAGLGTRLRPLTNDRPKALVEIAGEPFLAHQLRLLSRGGIERAVLLVGYRGEQIREYAGDGSAFRLHLDYAFDGPRLLGTAGVGAAGVAAAGFVGCGDDDSGPGAAGTAQSAGSPGSQGTVTPKRGGIYRAPAPSE